MWPSLYIENLKKREMVQVLPYYIQSNFKVSFFYILKTVLYSIQNVSTADKENFEKDVRELISGKPFTGHIHPEIHTISNRVRDKLHEGKINELKEHIEKLTKERSDDVPLLWFKIKEELKKTAKQWLNREQVKQIATDGGLENEKTLEAALQFFHGAGDIVYFSDIRDFVVLDPQWLIDQLSKIITIPKHKEQHMKPCDTRHWKTLEKYSFLHEDICIAVWHKDTMEGLLAIMRKYALLLPFSIKSDKGKVYLVPSLLPLKSQEEEKEGRQSENLPVRIVPIDGFIPVGLTSRLITALVNEHGWEYQGKIYKNAATLNVVSKKNDQKPQISIIEKGKALEVSCTKRPGGASKVLQQSVKIIRSILKNLKNNQDSKLEICCKKCGSWFCKELEEIPTTYDCGAENCNFDKSAYSIWVDTEVCFCILLSRVN